MQNEDLTAHREAAGALQHGDHGIAAGGVSADFLPLFKGEKGHAHQLVLHQRAADNLTVLIVHLSGQRQRLVLFNILIHGKFLRFLSELKNQAACGRIIP